LRCTVASDKPSFSLADSLHEEFAQHSQNKPIKRLRGSPDVDSESIFCLHLTLLSQAYVGTLVPSLLDSARA
jgi:hypothetical protein